jgi:hypothetical protein
MPGADSEPPSEPSGTETVHINFASWDLIFYISESLGEKAIFAISQLLDLATRMFLYFWPLEGWFYPHPLRVSLQPALRRSYKLLAVRQTTPLKLFLKKLDASQYVPVTPKAT